MRTVLPFLSLFLFLTAGASAQDPVFARVGDRKIEGYKALKNLDDVSIIQATIMFQNASKRTLYVTERNALGKVLGNYAGSKSGGNAASADLTAYLVFSDGEPSDADYQKASDAFYIYLNEQLLNAGINTTTWYEFAQSKYYAGLKGEKEDDQLAAELSKKGNAWKIYSANEGPRTIRYNPINHNYNVPAVRGTIQLANYGK
ncbi:MAG: hypothetical protein JXR22_08805, partial [Prolixibacteraceae bacterium]|nr:hypothetical protein [Prolixibacteraceae bacterium]